MTKVDLRARLTEEAMRLLAEGRDDLTLRAVARAAGVSAMAPYRHFADKAALLGAVKQEGFRRLREAVRLSEAGTPTAGEALIAQGLAYLAFAQAHPALFRLMFASPLASPAPMDGAADTAYGALVRRMSLLLPEMVEVGTTAAWSIVHGLTTLTLDGRLPPDPGHARAVLSLFVAGLAASRQAGSTARAGDQEPP